MQALVAFDDLDFTRDGSQVLADERVAFHIDGEMVELDLTDGHAKELRAALAPWIEAASRVTGSSRRRPDEMTRKERWAYNVGMRAFADAHGFGYRVPGGQVVYPAALKRAYAAYLDRGRR